MSIALIYPPFGGPHIPPFSIAALSGYLRAHDIPVSTIDANNEFYRWAFSPERLQSAVDYCEARTRELINSSGSRFREELELAVGIKNMADVVSAGDDLISFAEKSPHLPPSQLFRLFNIAGKITSFRYFPESLDVFFPGVNYRTEEDIYSSEDLLSAAERDGILTGFIDHITEKSEFGPDTVFVGLSVNFSHQIISALRIARAIKKKQPSVFILVGGMFITAHMTLITNPELFRHVDAFAFGDGEETLHELYIRLKDKKDWRDLPGIIHCRDNTVITNSERCPLDMDEITAPDYSGFDLDSYLISRKFMWLPYRLTRGCSWAKCTFCRTDLITYFQAASPDKQLKDLDKLMEQTGFRQFNFTDDECPPAVVDHLSESIIASGKKIFWSVSIRFERGISVERCKKWSKAGLKTVFMGLESFHDRILKKMKKGITAKSIEEALTSLRKAGIRVHVFMITGFPTETEEEAIEGYNRLVEHFRRGEIAGFIYSPFQILPGSPIAENISESGITSIDKSLYTNRDLPHPMYYFEAGGMPRQRVFELSAAFNNKLTIDYPSAGDIESLLSVKLPDKDIRGRLAAVHHIFSLTKMPYKHFLEDKTAN